MKIIGLLFLFLLLLFSCKKAADGPTPTSGQVVDKHSGAGVANATVSLMRNKISSTSAAYSFVESWDTDENGHFDLNFEGNEDYSYILMASTPLGHYTSWQDAPRVISGRKNKDVKVPAQAPAWIRIRIINEEPLDWAKVEIAGFGPVQQTIYNPLDTFLVEYSTSNIDKLISWRITNSQGQASIYQRELKFPSLDTTLLEIKF